jgi:hypothetical protein
MTSHRAIPPFWGDTGPELWRALGECTRTEFSVREPEANGGDQ